jgi:hypothetical protein
MTWRPAIGVPRAAGSGRADLVEEIMPNPYELLPNTAFWSSAVGHRDPASIDRLWSLKFPLHTNEKVSTAGSCFARHIGSALARHGYSWFDAEPAPPRLSEILRRKFNYGVFSARTGNIYTAALLSQWVDWAVGPSIPPAETWVRAGRYYDPFRPNIEPHGFASQAELSATREATLRALRRVIVESSLLVLTLGLTEAWLNSVTGHVYPVCPGTIAGDFDPASHEFHNYRYDEIWRQINTTFDLIRSLNPGIRFLLTVSPVPLTATASSEHVLVATTYSKSTLIAAAADIARARPDTDYFPAYEIICGSPFKGMFFEPNMRNVSQAGVELVMRNLFQGLQPSDDRPRGTISVDGAMARNSVIDDRAATNDLSGKPARSAPEEMCEDILLDAFSAEER